MSSRLERSQIEALYEAHALAVRRFLLGVLRSAELADEALQQTYLRVLERGHEVDAEKMRAWIYKVAFHEATALRRRAGIDARAAAAMALDPKLVDAAPAADEAAAAEEDRQRVFAAVEQLPAAQREAVRLRFAESQSFAEIAARLNIPLGTALTRVRLALKKLRSLLR